jgi:hypothetical protein
MMVYAASVDRQGIVLSTVLRVSRRIHHVILLTVGRAVETILAEIVRPEHLLVSLFMSTMSRLKKLDRTPTL